MYLRKIAGILWGPTGNYGLDTSYRQLTNHEKLVFKAWFPSGILIGVAVGLILGSLF